MKLINYNDYQLISDELNEFVVICREQNHVPTKEEIEDAIKFILLYNSGGTTLTESEIPNISGHLLERFELNEKDVVTGKDDYDSAVGTATSAAKGAGKLAGKGLAAAAGGAGMAAVGIGVLISYLWKRNKVKKAVQKEKDLEMQKMERYKKVADLKSKIAAIDSSYSTKMEIPNK